MRKSSLDSEQTEEDLSQNYAGIISTMRELELFDEDETSSLEQNPEDVNIFELIDKGEIGLLAQVLQRNPIAVLERNKMQQTPLHLAVSYTNPNFIRLEIIKLLLSYGADIETKDDEDTTPIHQATKAPHALKTLELLVAHAWGICNNNNEGHSIDHSKIIDAQDKNGMTPLHYALSRGRIESAECLLIHGASLAVREFTKNATPLLLCFEVGSNENTEKALGLCFAYSKRSGDNLLNMLQARDSDGNSMLHFACQPRSPSPRLVHALLSLGINPDIANNKNERAISWLHRPNSEESKQIITYINKPRAVKAEAMLLPIFEIKSENYLNSPGNNNRVKRLSIAPEQARSEISSPLRFFARTSKAGVDKTRVELLLQLRALLQDLSGITSRFHQCGKTIEASDPLLHQQLNCLTLLKRYSYVAGLVQSSDFISEILTFTRGILNHDGSHAFLTIAQFTKSLEAITKKISQDQNQAAFIDGAVVRDISAGDQIKSIRSASDQELAIVFSPFKAATMKALDEDKPALSVFRSSLARTWKENLCERDKNTAVRSFFECIQKYLSLIEIAQALVKLHIEEGDDEHSAILLLKNLRNEAFENQDAEHSPRPGEAVEIAPLPAISTSLESVQPLLPEPRIPDDESTAAEDTMPETTRNLHL